ncbi:MAG: type II toxin-antitoxin system RelE/ParE family toxin [archaeon]
MGEAGEALVLQRYEVLLEKKALKALDALDSIAKRRIFDALYMLRDYGFTPRLDIKKLLGYESHYRLRVGDYRVLFELEKPRTIKVYAMLHRRKAYQRR